jgi:hypothetical protein
VAGVHQQQLQPTLLQHIPDGLPILAGRLQHDLGDVVVLEPGGEGLQTGAERRVGTYLLASPAGAIGHANAGHDLVLADIQPRAAFVDHLHRRHLLVGLVRRPAGPTDQATLKDVLTATVRGAGTAPASVLSTGSAAPRRAELGRADPILIPRGGPRPWGSYQVSRAQRCADRRFPRSPASVGGKGMRSNAST